MNRWSLESTDARTTLRPTRWGRLRSGASTFVLVGLIVLAGLAVFFVPDFVRELPDQQSGYAVFFAGFLLGTSLLVATIAAIMKTLATWTWTFEWSRGVARLSTRTTMGHHFDDELDLDRVSGVRLERAGSALGTHVLALELDAPGLDDARIELLRTRTSLDQLEQIHRTLERSLRGAVP